jgi:flagellar protein FliJ
MAVFRFRLGTLLHVKEQLEKSAKNDLGLAVVRLETERARLRERDQEIREIGDTFTAALTGHIDPERICLLKAFLAAREAVREKQREVVKEAAQTVDTIRDRVVVLMQERKVLEKLREKEWEQFRVEGLQQEQRQADELVTYRSRSGQEAGTD